MPITIRANELNARSSETGEFIGIDAIADKTTEQRVAEIIAASNTEQEKIEQKGTDTIASIPSDYTDLYNIVDDSINAELIDGWSSPSRQYYSLSESTATIATATVSSGVTDWQYVVIPCSEGNVFTVSANGASAPRAWAFCDESYTILAKANANVTVELEQITAPAGSAMLILNRRPSITTKQSYKGELLSNIIDKIASSLTLRFAGTNGTIIARDTDYNDIFTPGNYLCPSAAISETLIDCPVKFAHRLFVFEMNIALPRYLQLIITANQSPRVLYRYYNGTSWYDWIELVSLQNLESKAYISNDPKEHEVIQNGTDYDALVTPGLYVVSSKKSAITMLHCPTYYGHRLSVYKLYINDSSVFQKLLSHDAAGTTFTRRRDKYGNWSSWSTGEQKNTNGYVPVYTQFTNNIPYNIGQITLGGSVNGDTLPFESGIASVTNYYDSNSDINGVIYSSVWRDGLDVYRNLTLETFYSALYNPASFLYTKNYTDVGISNAHAYYGGVCSTYVSKMLGMRLYHTTNQLQSILAPKAIQSYSDIELGDILLKEGHIALITQLLLNYNGALAGFVISEQASPEFKATVVPLNDFDSYIKNNGYTLMNKFGSGIVKMQPADFNKNILFEKGNNTYVTTSELTDGAWFYIPDTTNEIVYYSKDSGTRNSKSLSSLPTKDVNGYTVYNLVSCFSGVGSYEFYSDANESKGCLVKVIDTGTISLANKTLSLSGWNGCYPYNYYIVAESPITSTSPQNRAFSPSSESYYCYYSGNGGEISIPEGSTSINIVIPDNYIDGYSRYKVWLEYETGCGLKQVFSNVVQL